MNIRSHDFQSVPGGSAVKLEQGEIYAALAMAGLHQFEQALFIYYWTKDRGSRSGAWSLLLNKLVDMALQDDWGVRKPGLLDGMANTALDQLVNPRKFHGYSSRQWARAIGASNHGTWKTYKSRYADLWAYIQEVIDKGEEALRTQL